ncbi:hypothetical protein [Myxosarcina sp. GI1]|uniref:hypothetical protein n=1 Tax=Myxosarcina sp. GI1 TaxID=1541065 RepID=UPI00068D28D7|nr:hypothetical protein [Myxosarcina sp. GI1]
MIRGVTSKNRHKKIEQKSLEIAFLAIATLVTISIFLKAIIDIDTNYDTWWYHLPFAARIWGIVPKEEFIPELNLEYRFAGFPLLAHWLQGLLWFVTGRVQAANLVGLFGLIIYWFFLKIYFRVPLYLSAISLLAIPAVITHASTSFVDLPGNVGMSVLVMMTYLFYKEKRFLSFKDAVVMFLGAATAANIKPQLQPLTFLVCCAIALRFLWLYFKKTSTPKPKLVKVVPIALISSLLIFATPVKNIALYGNPFYPIKIQVAGVVLNHELVPDTYKEGNRPQKWLYSVLEIGTPPYWSTDQWNGGNDKYMDRGGGFFGAYVVFNVLLLVGLFIYEFIQNRQLPKGETAARTALLTVLIMSIVPANFPQSHELRYFMFWMICLVSLNLCLLSRSQIDWQRWRWLQPRYMGLVYLVFLTIVLSKVGSFYGKPVFYSLEKHISTAVKPELLSQIQPQDNICLISKHGLVNPDRVPFASIQHSFLYSSYFHSELDYSYSIRAAVDPNNCGDLKVVPKID